MDAESQQLLGSSHIQGNLINRIQAQLLYAYFNWRQDTFSDLQLILAANLSFLLLGGVLKGLVMPDPNQKSLWQGEAQPRPACSRSPGARCATHRQPAWRAAGQASAPAVCARAATGTDPPPPLLCSCFRSHLPSGAHGVRSVLARVQQHAHGPAAGSGHLPAGPDGLRAAAGGGGAGRAAGQAGAGGTGGCRSGWGRGQGGCRSGWGRGRECCSSG